MKEYEVKYFKDGKWEIVKDRKFYSYDKADGYSMAILDFEIAKATSVTEKTDDKRLNEIGIKMEKHLGETCKNEVETD